MITKLFSDLVCNGGWLIHEDTHHIETSGVDRRERDHISDSASLPDWRPIPVSLPDCPACGQAVEDVQWVGPITLVLEPCGHHIDDYLYRDIRGDESAC